MLLHLLAHAICLLAAGSTFAASKSISLVTLNCYWFLGQEENPAADKPRSKAEYELKAGHLVGLLPPEAPLFIALQEIGNGNDVAALARATKARYKAPYQHLFAQGRDTSTQQDVGGRSSTPPGAGAWWGKPPGSRIWNGN